MIVLSKKSAPPGRVVLLGAGGFIALSVLRRLMSAGLQVLPLSRKQLDLADDNAGDALAELLNPQDSLVFIAAKAPVKTDLMLLENIRVAIAVCKAIRLVSVLQVVYLSSDAVYADSAFPLHERSRVQPTSLHGIMHLTREVMLRNATGQVPLCILRPTLVFGKDDPHNGYGPNRFLRQAAAGENIELFGEGEERRDHVWVEDVAEIVCRCIQNRAAGELNIATGEVVSFRDIAQKAVFCFDNRSRVITKPRTSPIPHNGYRAFDIANLRTAFMDYRFCRLIDYIKNYRD